MWTVAVILSLVAVASFIWGRTVFSVFFKKTKPLSETSGNYRVSPRLRLARRICFVLAIAAYLLSILPISIGFSGRNGDARAVRFVLDVSRSMDAIDPMKKESRLERAKTLISKIVIEQPQNRYSLTAFAGEPFEAIPETTDSNAFLLLMSGITSKYSSSVGTDIPKVLHSIVDKGAKSPDDSTDAGPSELAVFLTDGGDAEDTPTAAVLRSEFEGGEKRISVLSVTFGDAQWAPIPLGKDFMGNPVYLSAASWEAVVTKANPETAARLAEATDGISANEKDAESAFKKQTRNVRPVNADASNLSDGATNEISPFVFASLLALVAAFLIRDKILVWSKKPFSQAS